MANLMIHDEDQDDDKTQFHYHNDVKNTDSIESILSSSINTIPLNLNPPTANHPDITLLDDVASTGNSNTFNSNITHLTIGDVLKNRFEIIDKLGEGGMGMVFKAIDRRKVEAKSRNPYIAIKVLNPSLAKNEMLVAGLQRECEKVQALSHPNIITVYDFDKDGDHVFMSMEFLAGKSLNELIKECAPSGGMKVQQAMPLIRHMGKALTFAHRNNIVHSDFKPANVFITENNEVKVLDFGIAAKTKHDQDSDVTIFDARTEGGHTPPYASFEMINGAKADPRDDIYAYGLVIYEMLTGKHPYNRKSASAVYIEQTETGSKIVPKPITGLTKNQWQMLQEAIEIMQDKRPKNFEKWLDEFYTKQQWLDEFGPKPKKHSKVWLGAGVSALLLLVIAGYFGLGLLKQNPQTEIAASAINSQSTPTSVAPASVTVQPVIKPPLAQPGSNQQGKVGEPIQLNGSESQSGDGDVLNYSWRLAKNPPGSLSVLQNPTAVNPQFIPDKAGDYIVELQVWDKHNQSVPVLMTISVAETTPVLQQMDNSASALSLTTSKMKYKIGELLQINVHVDNTGYLRVVYVGAAGEVSELLPNEQQATKVKANTDFLIPPKSAKFKLKITGPVGKDKIVAVYSEAPITNLEKIVNSDGEIAEFNKQNLVIKTVAYDVVN
ncbi:MAG: protein kinase [Methylobacter sp.]|nr:protein kinase [Methylobacter sp.]